MGLGDQLANLLINGGCNLIGVFQGSAATTSGEWVALFLTILDSAQIRAHAIFGHHCAGDLRRLFNISRCACRRSSKDEFFTGATAHGKDQAGEKFGLGVHTLVVLSRSHGVTAGTAASQNGDLVDAFNIFHRPSGEGVAAFVIGGNLLLVLGDNLRGAARATNHTVSSFLQCVGSNNIAVHACGKQRSFVQHVLQIRTGHTGGALSQRLEIHIWTQWLILRMDLQDVFTTRKIRVGDRDLAVETTGAQQRRIQNVGTVRRCDEDDALAIAEAVHLHQQLVQGLLTLIVAAAHTCATLTTDGVDLVDEDNAGRVSFRLGEEVTHAGGADADEHFDEVRA